MAITVADNFSYQGKKPLDGRDTFATLAAMKAYAEASVYDGCLSYCDEDGKRYEFKSTNTVDPTTGKWREYSSGGGGQTYNDFTGATASTAGAHGLVPAPSAGDEGKVLFGNGAWGALPSVDLSVLSNEANILSYDEKVVGQAPDGRLLYQKTVACGSGSSSTSVYTNHNISNIGKIWHTFGILNEISGSAFTIANPIPTVNGGTDFIRLQITNTQVVLKYADVWHGEADVTLRYTKTTDSPLPSDVKFAGVTSSGEVILAKTLTGTATGAISDWFEVGNTATLISGIRRVMDVVSNGYTSYSGIGYTSQIEAQCNSGQNIYVGQRITSENIQYNYEITICYTLAS